MRRWCIGTNNYYFTSSIYLEEAPWYIFVIETGIQNICSWIPNIPLPKFKIIRDGEKTDLKEYYGSIHDLFHIFICDPLFQWSYKKIKIIPIELPYLFLRKIIPDEFDDTSEYSEDEEEVRIVRENFEYSSSINDEFNEVYHKLENIFKTRFSKD